MYFINVGNSQNILINIGMVKRKKYWLFCFDIKDSFYFYKYSENSEHLEPEVLLSSWSFNTSPIPFGGGDSDAVLHNTAGHRDLFFLGMDGLVGLFVEKWWVMTLALAASPGEG